LKLANRELGTVEGIGQDGRISLKMDGGREVELDSVKNPHLDHGYAVTSHSSQGQTADRVLIHVDTELGAKDLLNNRMAYVAVSRGAYDAQIFTNDREKLGAALGHDVSHSSAQATARLALAARYLRICYRDRMKTLVLPKRRWSASLII
jgi:ATP-dependent exoDNAse (exonuclease V) alpha subunit